MATVTSTRATVSATPSGMPGPLQWGDEVDREGRATDGGGEEAGQGHPDLHGGEEPVGVGVELGDDATAPAPLGQGPGLAVAQRDQRDLGGREDAADEHEEDDESQRQGQVDHATAGLPSMAPG